MMRGDISSGLAALLLGGGRFPSMGGLGGMGQSPEEANERMMAAMLGERYPLSHTLQPRFVYGITLKDRDKKLADAFIKNFEPDIKMYADDVVRGYGGNLTYGCELSMDEVQSKARTPAMDQVDKFVEEYGLGNAEVLLAISGTFHCEHEDFLPKKKTSGRKSKKGAAKSEAESKESEDDSQKKGTGEEQH